MVKEALRTVQLQEFAQPAVAFLAIVICIVLWALVGRPLPAVVAQTPTPVPELAPPPGPNASAPPRPYAPGQPGSLSVADEVRARKLFAQACSPCHRGQQDLFNSANYRHGSDDQEVFHSIKTGFPGTPMGRSALADSVIWDLVLFLKGNRT